MFRSLSSRITLAALAIAIFVGIPCYLDARIPRATAVVQIHPETMVPVRATGISLPAR